VEGSGGIVCPIRYDNQKIFLEDIIKALGLEIILVSNALLGSINATVLSVEYARSRGIGIRGIILNQYQGSEMEQDNYKMIQEITGVSILATVPLNAKKIELNIEGV
jgi:dethiobiotin synthetase